MKSLKEIMSEMGFNPNAPIDTQKAFFRHLAKEASKNPDLSRETTEAHAQKEHSKTAGVQLEFDLIFKNDKKQVS